MLLSMPTGTNSLRERLSNQVAAIIPILTPYPYWVGLPKTFFSRLLGSSKRDQLTEATKAIDDLKRILEELKSDINHSV